MQNNLCVCFTNFHHVIYGLDVGVLQPQRRQAEHPGVVLLALLQTLDVILHGLTQEALSVCLQVGQGLLIQLQLSLHLDGVPAWSEEEHICLFSYLKSPNCYFL